MTGSTGNPVRVIDAFVELIDWGEVQFADGSLVPEATSQPPMIPRSCSNSPSTAPEPGAVRTSG